MKNLIPDHELNLPLAATADVRRDPTGHLVVDLTDPATGHVTRLHIPAAHPGDARVTAGSLADALHDLDGLLHDAELAYEHDQAVAA